MKRSLQKYSQQCWDICKVSVMQACIGLNWMWLLKFNTTFPLLKKIVVLFFKGFSDAVSAAMSRKTTYGHVADLWQNWLPPTAVDSLKKGKKKNKWKKGENVWNFAFAEKQVKKFFFTQMFDFIFPYHASKDGLY